MKFSFTETFDAFQKGCNSLARSLQEKVLPTPGKRKRDEQDETLEIRSSRRPRLEEQQEEVLPRVGSLEPSSQFAVATRLPIDMSRTTSTAAFHKFMPSQPEPVQDLLEPSASPSTLSLSPPNGVKLPVLSGQSKNPTVAPGSRRWFRNQTLGGRNAQPQNRPGHPGGQTLLPWQRRYANQIQQRGHFSFGAAVRMSDNNVAPWQWTQSRAFPSQDIARNISPQQDLKERDELRRMTQAAMLSRGAPKQAVRRDTAIVDLEPSQTLTEVREPQGESAALAANPTLKFTSYRDLLKRDQIPEPIPILALSKYELEKQREARVQEEKRKARKDATERCNQLMGARQDALFARVGSVLGETSAARNSASEISKASMQYAQKEAKMLMGTASEIDLIEEEQEGFARRRKDQAAAHEEALSVAKNVKPSQFWDAPVRSPLTDRTLVNGSHKPSPRLAKKAASKGGATARAEAKKASIPPRKGKEAAPPPPEDDVVNLLSSDDDEPPRPDQVEGSEDEEAEQSESEEESDDESSGQEGDERELSKQFRGILVDDRRVTPQFPRLTKKQYKLYRDALNDNAEQDAEMFLHKGSNIGVSRSILRCLKPRTWLNDEVMNLMMGLLQERDRSWREAGKDFPKCHFMNTFFFNKLFLDKGSYDYSQVSRWTMPKKLKLTPQLSKSILDCDRVIAPVHLGCHWTCAVADLANKEFIYLDSMLDKHHKVMKSFVSYIGDEYKDKRKEEVDTKSWPVRYRQDIPRQLNGYDCGIFACMFAEHMSRNASLDFSQSDMDYFRVMITSAIMDQKLISSF